MVRVYSVFAFFVLKFANEKRITNSFVVFRFQTCERKRKQIPFSFFVFKFANEKRKTNSFFVFISEIRKVKKEKRRQLDEAEVSVSLFQNYSM